MEHENGPANWSRCGSSVGRAAISRASCIAAADSRARPRCAGSIALALARMSTAVPVVSPSVAASRTTTTTNLRRFAHRSGPNRHRGSSHRRTAARPSAPRCASQRAHATGSSSARGVPVVNLQPTGRALVKRVTSLADNDHETLTPRRMAHLQPTVGACPSSAGVGRRPDSSCARTAKGSQQLKASRFSV